MEETRKLALRKILLATDLVLIAASMVAAYATHAALRGVFPFLKEPPLFRQYAVLAYLTLPLWLSLIVALRLHRFFERRWSPATLFLDLVKLHLLGLVGLSVLLFLTQAVINRSIVALFLGSTFALMWLARILLGYRLAHPRADGYGRLRLLLVGDALPEMVSFARSARGDPLPPRIVGRLSASPAAADEPEDSPPRLGAPAELERVLLDEAVDHVLFFSPHDRPELAEMEMRVLAALGVPAGFAVRQDHPVTARPRLAAFYGRDFMTYEVSPKSPEALTLKHGFDFVAAALAVTLLAPILAAVAAAILVTMGRPVLFVQERAGLYGRRFRMLKFRTMVRGAERQRDELAHLNEMSGPVFKIRDDPRITRLGRWLRRTSLDELPQLFNVLIGTMSLVGPRPLPLGEQQSIRGWHRRRLSMKPGITGLWQVSGRSDVDFAEWIELDLRYIDSWSLATDARILLRTIPAVLGGSGSR